MRKSLCLVHNYCFYRETVRDARHDKSVSWSSANNSLRHISHVFRISGTSRKLSIVGFRDRPSQRKNESSFKFSRVFHFLFSNFYQNRAIYDTIIKIKPIFLSKSPFFLIFIPFRPRTQLLSLLFQILNTDAEFQTFGRWARRGGESEGKLKSKILTTDSKI